MENEKEIVTLEEDNEEELTTLEEDVGSGSGTETNNYNDLSNKPKINNVELSGNKTLEELGIKQEYTADDIKFNDGKTFQQKYNDGELKGANGKNYSVEVVESTTTTLEIQANKFYKFEEVSELNLTLAEITDNTQLNEFMFEFTSGETATTLTLPDTVKWLETPTIEANKIYQCSIVDNIGILVGVANV